MYFDEKKRYIDHIKFEAIDGDVFKTPNTKGNDFVVETYDLEECE